VSTECIHIHDDRGHDVGFICRPGPSKYQPAVHRTGSRKWEPIGKPLPTISGAFRVLGKVLDENRRKNCPRYNRAGIWAVEPFPSYYEPHQVYEVTVT